MTSKSMRFLVSAAIASAGMSLTPLHAQCAGCGADVNKADSQKADAQAKENADKAYHDTVKDNSGNGMAHDAINKTDKYNDAVEKASHESDPNR